MHSLLICSGCSAAWLARLVWVQEVGGSNPSTPTIFLEGASKNPFIGMSGEKENFSETQAYVLVRAASDKFSDAANRPRKEVFRDALKNG